MVYPDRCAVCDDVIKIDERGVCTNCLGKLRVITGDICIHCGREITGKKDLCADCRNVVHKFDGGRVLYDYESARESIYMFKYGGRAEYAEFFGEEVVDFLGNFIRLVKPDFLVPVPLHKSRMRKRGYNQASLVANEISKRMNIPVKEHLVERVKKTRPLKSMKRNERQNCLKNAFIIKQIDVKSKCVIIIDDIYTTGATMDEIAGLLKNSGVQKVYFVALASARGTS